MIRRKISMIIPRLITVLIILAISTVGPCFGDDIESEKAIIMQEARSYFDAELSGDPKAVWSALAPSSVFRRDYSFDDFVALQSRSDFAVKSYEVIEVVEIMENNDRNVLPDVEKLAAVRFESKSVLKMAKKPSTTIYSCFSRKKAGGSRARPVQAAWVLDLPPIAGTRFLNEKNFFWSSV